MRETGHVENLRWDLKRSRRKTCYQGYIRPFEIESLNFRTQNTRKMPRNDLVPEDCNLRAMIQIFIGRKSHCTLCWMGSESTTRSISLALFICLCTCLHRPLRFSLPSPPSSVSVFLFFSFSTREEEKLRRGDEKGRRKDRNSGNEQGVEEKARSGNRFMHRRAQALA